MLPWYHPDCLSCFPTYDEFLHYCNTPQNVRAERPLFMAGLLRGCHPPVLLAAATNVLQSLLSSVSRSRGGSKGAYPFRPFTNPSDRCWLLPLYSVRSTRVRLYLVVLRIPVDVRDVNQCFVELGEETYRESNHIGLIRDALKVA
jgi:hypothetical protein